MPYWDGPCQVVAPAPGVVWLTPPFAPVPIAAVEPFVDWAEAASAVPNIGAPASPNTRGIVIIAESSREGSAVNVRASREHFALRGAASAQPAFMTNCGNGSSLPGLEQCFCAQRSVVADPCGLGEPG
jgi:hypothetical protein